MVWHKSVIIFLFHSMDIFFIYMKIEEMITLWPKVEKAIQRAPLSPTLHVKHEVLQGMDRKRACHWLRDPTTKSKTPV